MKKSGFGKKIRYFSVRRHSILNFDFFFLSLGIKTNIKLKTIRINEKNY